MSASLEQNGVHYDRSKMDEIINSEFNDPYEPPHQLGPDYILPTDSFRTTKPDGALKLQIAESGSSARKPISLVTFFKQTVDKHGEKKALSVKRGGRWIHWTYNDYWRDSHIVAKAFLKLGLERFHCVAILGFNAPEWFFSNHGAILAGGISTGIYPTNSPSACEYILQHSRANIVVVENEFQLNKIIQIKSNLKHLKAIIQYTGTPTHDNVFSWDDVMKIGKSVPDEALERRIKSLAVNQCCSIVYTSGTTGLPKAVMLTHDNYVYIISVHGEEGLPLDNPPIDFSIVSYLPLNHLAAQLFDLYGQILIGGHVYFAQPDAFKGTLVNTMQEAKPTTFGGVPRIYEKMKEKIEETMSTMNWFKKSLTEWAMECTRQFAKSQLNGSPTKPRGYKIARRIIRKIRSKIGFDKTEHFGCGGAPLSKEIMEFFLGLNIIISEGYGLSECSGVQCVNSIHSYRPYTVGKKSGFNEMKLIDVNAEGHGEICLRGRNVFMGYMFDEEKTEEAIDEGGWLHTGDIGRLDEDGYLYITGRIKELIITSGGENIAPVPIEEEVKAQLPFINQTILIGDKRKFLSMLLTVKTNIDMETFTPLDTLSDVSLQWCRSVGSKATTVQEILQGPDPHVMEAVQKGIDRANLKAVSNAWKIQKWVILPNDFTLQADELSPTMKLKRHVINENYKDIIDKLYQ